MPQRNHPASSALQHFDDLLALEVLEKRRENDCREVSGDTIGRLIGRGHNSGRGGLGLPAYLLSALHHRTILYSQPRHRPYPENLEIESYSRYIFPAYKITYNIEMTWQ